MRVRVYAYIMCVYVSVCPVTIYGSEFNYFQRDFFKHVLLGLVFFTF